jgi:hypothetical protein
MWVWVRRWRFRNIEARLSREDRANTLLESQDLFRRYIVAIQVDMQLDACVQDEARPKARLDAGFHPAGSHWHRRGYCVRPVQDAPNGIEGMPGALQLLNPSQLV